MPKRVPSKNFSRPPVSDALSPAAPEAPSEPQNGSKARTFARAAETAGWTVTRKIRGRDTDAPVRTVTAVREDETLTASWAGERALPYGEFGTYVLADATGGPLLSRKLSGAKQALEYVQTPPERVKRPVAAGQDGTETVIRDMNWNPEEEDGAYVLANVAGKTLRWVGKLPDGKTADVMEDRVPITEWEDIETKDGKKASAQRQVSNRHLKIEEYLDGRRILCFVSAESGHFRSVNLADLVSVS